jgi:molybdopterin biosynthesis enzyme
MTILSMTALKKIISGGMALALLISASASWAEDDITVQIIKSMHGAKVINMHLEPIPQQTSMMLVVMTTDGVKKFIVAPGKVGAALVALNAPTINNAINPDQQQQTIAANNQLAMTLARRQPGMEPPPVPVQTSIARINAPAMISRTALSANQLASK